MTTPLVLRRALVIGTAVLATATGCVAAPSARTSSNTVDQVGGASFYDERGVIAFPGSRSSRGCAHKTLRAGTVVTVTYRGRSTTCAVDDRGPYVSGRVIDLQPGQFDDLASLSTGVLSNVSLSW